MAWSMSTNLNYPWSLAIFFSIGRYPRPSPSGLSYFKKLTTSWDLFFPLLAFAEIQFQTTEQEGCRRGPFCPSFSALPTMLTITSETFQSEETSSLALKLQLPVTFNQKLLQRAVAISLFSYLCFLFFCFIILSFLNQ